MIKGRYGISVLAACALVLLPSCGGDVNNVGEQTIPPMTHARDVAESATALSVRGVWAAFERPGWGAGFDNGDVINNFTSFDAVDGGTVSSVIATQLDLMRAVGVNTISFWLETADTPVASPIPPKWLAPPRCYVYPSLGLQYPHPTPPELANLAAFLDLLHNKGIKVILILNTTHMEKGYAANARWLRPIIQSVMRKPALYQIDFGGDVHVNKFSGKSTCGIPAEPPLWNGASSTAGKYVQSAIGDAHAMGVPYGKLSAESIVGGINDPAIVAMKEIFDNLQVPQTERSYSLSWYEAPKCKGVSGPCKDESPSRWAAHTMKIVSHTIGHNGAHAVAAEFGDGNAPVLLPQTAINDLLPLWKANGVDGGAYYLWTYRSVYQYGFHYLPVLYRGIQPTYTAVEPVLAKYYGGSSDQPTPIPSVTPSPTPCPALPGGTGLLANGDFSSPGQLDVFTTGESVATGWTVTAGSVQLESFGNQAPYSLCSVNLDEQGTPGAITSAAFSTMPGRRYTIAFMFSGVFGLPRFKNVEVHAGSQSKSFQWDVAMKGPGPDGAYWGKETWAFTASSATTSVTFSSLDSPAATDNGPLVAGVSVTGP